MIENITETPSCWNCTNCHSWNEPPSWDDPGDSGWECQANKETEKILKLEEKYGHLLESVAVCSIAAECPKYSYQTPIVEDEPDYESMTEVELTELREASEAEDLRHCIKMGWYDPSTKEFTNEYYAASDRAYDARR